MTDDTRPPWLAAWDAAIKVTAPVILALCGWAHGRLSDHEARLVRIEATRYTAEDGRRDLEASRAEIHAALAKLADTLAANTALLQRLDERVAALQRAGQR